MIQNSAKTSQYIKKVTKPVQNKNTSQNSLHATAKSSNSQELLQLLGRLWNERQDLDNTMGHNGLKGLDLKRAKR